MIDVSLTQEEFYLLAQALHYQWEAYTRDGKEDDYCKTMRLLGEKLNTIIRDFNTNNNPYTEP